MDGISSANTSLVDTAFEEQPVAVCNKHADTIVQSLQIQRDGLIEDMRKIQLQVDQLNQQLDEIDAKHDPVKGALQGAISNNPVSSIVGAISGFVGTLSQEAVEMAPVREAMREKIQSMEDKRWGLDHVDNEIEKQIRNCDR